MAKTTLQSGVGTLEGVHIKPGVAGSITFFDGETELCTLNLTAAANAIDEKIVDLTNRDPAEAALLQSEGEWSVLNEQFETELSVDGDFDPNLIIPKIV